MGSVTINIAQLAQGLVASSDAGAGLVTHGTTEGSVTVGTPFLVNSMQDVTTLGLTSTNNAFVINQLQQLYNELNKFGIVSAPVYVLLVASTMTIAQMADYTQTGGAIKLLNYAAGAISLLGLISNDTAAYPGGTGLTTTNGINADCYTAITNAQALYANQQALQRPLRILIGGTSFTGTATSLTAQTANNAVRCVIGDTASGGGAAVGLLLGRYMAIPVQRKASRVANGAISSATAYIGSVTADQYTSQSTITSKGFITFQTYAQKSGFYFTTDIACTATTDTYYNSPKGRIVDKAQKVTYAYCINSVDDEVPVNDDGTIDTGFAKSLESAVVNTLNENMRAVGNITSAACQVPLTQNVRNTNQVTMSVTVNGPGYSTSIVVTLGAQ